MKKLLTDCDGVLLDWNTAFHKWFQDLGYVRNNNQTLHIEDMYDLDKHVIRNHIVEFNNSKNTRFLKPYKDAVFGIKKLKENGFYIECITSIGNTDCIIDNRLFNLNSVFDNMIDSVQFLPTYSKKDKILKQYKNTNHWWIDDSISECITGKSLGLRSLLMDKYSNTLPCVTNWSQICDIILEK